MSGNVLAQTMQALEQAIARLPAGEIPSLTGDLKRLETLAIARLMQRPEPDNGPLLDAPQVAVRLNVPVSYVYEQARRKALKSTKMGKYVRFTESAVRAYQAKQGG